MENKKSKGCVLAVDDDPAISSLLKGKLSREGFFCMNCSGGEEALEVLAHETFDIIITDL